MGNADGGGTHYAPTNTDQPFATRGAAWEAEIDERVAGLYGL